MALKKKDLSKETPWLTCCSRNCTFSLSIHCKSLDLWLQCVHCTLIHPIICKLTQVFFKVLQNFVTCWISTFIFMSSIKSSAWRSPVSCLVSDVLFFPCKGISLHWNWFIKTSPVTFHTVAPEILIREVIFFSHWRSC